MSHTANIGHPRRQITDKTALLSSAAAQTLIAQSFLSIFERKPLPIVGLKAFLVNF